MATRTESDNSELRRERDDLRKIAQRNVEASGRGCGRPHNFDYRSLGRVASVDHVHICEDVDGHGTRRFGVGGRVVSSVGSRGGRTKLASAKRRCNPGSAIVPSKCPVSPSTDCEVSGSERRPTQVHSPAESTVTMSRSSQADSVRGVIVTVLNMCQSQAHHQVQRMIPRLLQSMCSQARSRMVSFLSFPRGGVDVVEGTGSRQRLCFQFRPIDLLYLMPRSPGTTGWSMSQSPTQ